MMSMETEMVNISEYYSGLYVTVHQQPPKQDEDGKKRRRRKKKSKGGGGGKRKLSAEQANFLEINFGSEHKLESERKERLASEIGLDPRQVAVWFQNRRARWRSKKLEEEYSRLKTEHEATVLDNCRLQSEVLRLKEKLSETEKEMQRLMERFDITSNTNNSPISSLTIEAMDQPFFLEDFGMGELEYIFNVPENNYIHGMDWMNLYM